MSEQPSKLRDALPVGTVLRGYVIEAVLGYGGYGVVYRARHQELGHLVAIKEYLPADLSVRDRGTVFPRSTDWQEVYEDGKRRFLEEAKRIVQFTAEPGVVTCLDFFRANGTAYLVMEHVDGLPLADLLKGREGSGRPLGEEELLSLVTPLLKTLSRLHEAGVLHRDVKPSNILVRRADGQPMLIDFGAAKEGVALHSKSVAPYTEGYAALEQVGEGGLGPWTDIYGVGAVMWRIVAGGSPPWTPPNPSRVELRAAAVLTGKPDPLPLAMELGAGRFSRGLLEAVDRCLVIRADQRIQSAEELSRWLGGQNEPRPESAPEPLPEAPPSRPKKKVWRVVARILAALVLGAAVWIGMTGRLPWDPPNQGDADPPAKIAEDGPVEPLEPMVEHRPADTVRRIELPAHESPAPTPERPPEPELRSSPSPPSEWTNSVGMRFVQIPAGEFFFGANSNLADDDEQPVTQVKIRSAFWMGKYEVTHRQWMAVMGSNPSRFKNCGPDCPVESVSWDDVQRFVRSLNAMEETARYRLPTEAEWEYAARAGTTTDTPAGNLQIHGERTAPLLDGIAWYGGNSGVDYAGAYNCLDWAEKQYPSSTCGPHPVGEKSPNAFGLHDMLGNVWEWVRDWHGEYPGGSLTDPTGPAEGSNRVFRGCDWGSYARSCRSSDRLSDDPGIRDANLGFRLLASAPGHITRRELVERESPAPTPVRPPEPEPRSRLSRSSEWTNSVGMSFVRIPAGEFLMGSNSKLAFDDERAVTQVQIQSAFWMGKYEVTQRQWMAVMGSNPSRFEDCGPDCPVESVSWDDVQGFVRRLNAMEGSARYRLPTEAEWEYAARAGTSTDTPAGDLQIHGERNAPLLDGIAWYGGNSGVDYVRASNCLDWEGKQYASRWCGPHPVGGKDPNAFGLHDMLGNVWEWVRDWHGEYPGGSLTDPTGPAEGSRRGLRGCGWLDHARICRSSYRFWREPGDRSTYLGFRLLASAPGYATQRELVEHGTAGGGGASQPRLLFKVEPEYSEEARKAGLQGTVMLSVEVWEDGLARNIRVLRSLGLGLDEKAVEAVKQWQFSPGEKDGKPVRVLAQIQVSFRLLE